MRPVKYVLSEDRLPGRWYNIVADLPEPCPPMLHPGTNQPVTAEDLAPLFPPEIVAQELSGERYVPIPDEVRAVYQQWRPSPLFRAHRLEAALGTPARIYYKYEGVSPAGSHKPNTAVPQAYYNKMAGIDQLTTETGAGQWGSALAMACAFFGLSCQVFMVRASYDQKPYRRALIETFGGRVLPSPSTTTGAGSRVLEADPDSPGSLGIAISEAVEVAATSGGKAKYALGSVLNHVLMHQTVIGEEALAQFELAEDYPDVVIACAGGGSNLAGIAFPFLREHLAGRRPVRVVGVEPTSCPSMTAGEYKYDFGDSGELAPLAKMHTLGHTFIPPRIHAGGLRYHGMAPLVSHLVDLKLIEPRAENQLACFEAAITFARAEGIVPAPESSHAIRAVIDEATRCREEGTAQAILVNLSGHGHFDMQAYLDYQAGILTDNP